MRSIILEGLNGTGKTILAKRLAMRLPHHFHIQSRGITPTKDHAIARMDFEIEALKNNVIIDRLTLISDFVYAKAMHVGRTYDFIDAIQRTNPIIIYCTMPKIDLMETLEDHLYNRYPHDIAFEISFKIDEYITRYDEMLNMVKEKVITDNWKSQGKDEDFMNEIIALVNK